MNVTKKDLEQIVSYINNKTEDIRPKHYEFALATAYGKTELVLLDKRNGGERRMTGLHTKAELFLYLDGMRESFRMFTKNYF